MDNFYIRPARPNDAERIAEIHIKSWEYAYSPFLPHEILDRQAQSRPEKWRNLCSENVDTDYAVILSEQIIGFIGLSEVRDDDLPKNCIELQGIYFSPEFIGKGYGTLAMNWAFSEAALRGYGMMSLWVFEKNEKARRFYESCGYRLDTSARETAYYDERVLRYVKSLTED